MIKSFYPCLLERDESIFQGKKVYFEEFDIIEENFADTVALFRVNVISFEDFYSTF